MSEIDEQRELEARALRVAQLPAVARGREQAAQRFKTIVGRDGSAEAWARFDAYLAEYAFNYVLKACNLEPDHPKVLGHLYSPPHDWMGLQVPGSRGWGDGPDQHYVVIPVEHGARYELHGRRRTPAPADVPLTLVGNVSLTMTLASLDLTEPATDDDGSFTVTIGPEPALAGHAGAHLQTQPGARYLFIRECRSDWRQRHSLLRVRRLDPPCAQPWSDEQVAERAAQLMVDDVPQAFWFLRIFATLEPNVVGPLLDTGGVGGLRSQRVSFVRLRLDDDEAFVFTVASGGAAFRNLVLHDAWYRTLDYPQRTSSFNVEQARPNPDGTISYVVAHDDPGVHNWLDPLGLSELLVMGRWQGVPAGGEPAISGRLVKRAELDAALSAEVPRVTPAERAAQLAERHETFRLRYETD